jgi:hypothetical protein
LDYWNGSAWVRIALNTHWYAVGQVDGPGYSHGELFAFTPVTGSKVRYSMDNSQYNVLGTCNIHGWINEFEVYLIGSTPPTCHITLNKQTFVSGDSITVQGIQVSNPGPKAQPINYKFYVDLPNGGTYGWMSGGSDSSFSLPPGASIPNALAQPVTLAAVTSTFPPRGGYRIVCSFEDPVTGNVLATEVDNFLVQ